MVSLALGSSKSYGIGLNGVCGLKLDYTLYIIRFIIEILMVFVCFFCLFIFHSKIPKNSYFNDVKIFRYYEYYMVLFGIIELLTLIGYLVAYVTY
jgi:uncharacterized protein YhhL (DUF1145 family)